MLLFTAEGSCRLFVRSGSHLHPTNQLSSRIGRNLRASTQRQQQGTKTREAREKKGTLRKNGGRRGRKRERKIPWLASHGVTSLTVCARSLSHVRLFAAARTLAHQAPLSMRFLRQEYWSRLPFPSAGDLPDPGIESESPALADGSFIAEPSRKSLKDITSSSYIYVVNIFPSL